METTIWILAFIVLGYIAINQAWQKVVLKATINRQKEIIEIQRETIYNQSATIKNYQSILSKGVDVTEKDFTEKQVRYLVDSVTEFMSHNEPEEFDEWFEKKIALMKK